MRKTQVMSLCLGFMLSVPVVFAENKGEHALLLKLNDADVISVNLTDAPQYWTQGDYLFLKTPIQLQKFDISSVKEIVFGEGTYASQIGQSSQNSVFPSLTTDFVYVKGEEVGDIRIYSADGKLMPLVSEKQADGVRVDVSGFPLGIYQLSLGSQAFKFIKGTQVK